MRTAGQVRFHFVLSPLLNKRKNERLTVLKHEIDNTRKTSTDRRFLNCEQFLEKAVLFWVTK